MPIARSPYLPQWNGEDGSAMIFPNVTEMNVMENDQGRVAKKIKGICLLILVFGIKASLSGYGFLVKNQAYKLQFALSSRKIPKVSGYSIISKPLSCIILSGKLSRKYII